MKIIWDDKDGEGRIEQVTRRDMAKFLLATNSLSMMHNPRFSKQERLDLLTELIESRHDPGTNIEIHVWAEKFSGACADRLCHR
jgi:hypothetical protein